MNLSLQYTFKDPSLLKMALTHASLGHEQKSKIPHNERLEFLGDAVLSLTVSEYLYQIYGNEAEGRLTKIRAHLVNRHAMVAMAKTLNLGEHLLLGTSEASHGGRTRASNLANAMEAIIGAIFLDGGYLAARVFVISHIKTRLSEIVDSPEPTNSKGILQEILHRQNQKAIYRILSEQGPAHQKNFEVCVEINGQIYGNGTGSTKKEAEMAAAREALDLLKTKPILQSANS